MKSKRLAVLAVLTALALGIHVLEGQFPLPIKIPGVKLGLANIITLFTVFTLSWRDAAWILTGRVILGAMFAGFSSIFFSAGGGLCAFLVTVGLKQVLPEKQIWIAGILAAEAHSLGQLAVAWLLTDTPYILLYLPVLLVCSLFTGLLTGLCAQILVLRGKKLWKTILQ